MILPCNLSLSILLPVSHAASFDCKTLLYDFFQLLEAKRRSFTDQPVSADKVLKLMVRIIPALQDV